MAIGYHKHGKTEFYRDFLRHLRASEDRFEDAEGSRGMVMVVFTLPSYDVVFKLIKDRFDYPKDSSRSEVMRKYRLVFEHDRAGRLVEAHEFEHLRIAGDRFRPELLEELQRSVADSVRIEDNDIFPEEFPRFLGLRPDLLETLIAYHRDLFEAVTWRRLQTALRAGHILEICPYGLGARLLPKNI
jgi:isocitrate dehydrogenase kinase/phosphatase